MASQAPSPEAQQHRDGGHRRISNNTFGDGTRIHQGDVYYNPGLALNIAVTWKSSVAAFDLVASGRHYGMDYEILRVKLEVERIRLLTWGEVVGLSDAQLDATNPSIPIDKRLVKEEVRSTVVRLLGCIEHVFANAEALQKKYGLKEELSQSIALSDLASQAGGLGDNQLVLGSIFKRAYTGLRKSAKEIQQATPLKRKATWAISDKEKFSKLVAEIKGFNDSLDCLFPDITKSATSKILGEIGESCEIRDLQLLQQAAADEHEEISETASIRLENLGATATTGLEDLASVLAANAPTNEADAGSEDASSECDAGGTTKSGTTAREKTFFEKEMEKVDLFVTKKSQGSLHCSIHVGDEYVARCWSYVGWEGHEVNRHFSHWDDRDKGFVTMPHMALDLYRRKKYIKKRRDRDDYDPPTSEDYLLLDPESDPQYDNVYPGTITIEGYALECWDHENRYGKPRNETILSHAGELPQLPAKKLLRRVHELKFGGGKLGWSPKRDEEDLKEFMGSARIKYVQEDLTWEETHVISDLYGLLNRSDVFSDFTRTSSISLVAMNETENSHGFCNFLWQVILGKELARRMENFPDAGISGFTPRIYTTLIVSDLWIRNTEIILVEHDHGKELKEFAEKRREEEAKKKGEGGEPVKTADEIKADALKLKANAEIVKRQWDTAIRLYTEALELTPKNTTLLANRAAAYSGKGEHNKATEDAEVALQNDPTYAKAWSRLGLAKMALNDPRAAMVAYQNAITVSTDGGTELMKKGLEEAKAKVKELDKVEKKNPWDERWDIENKTLQLHSLVHEKQVEGLLKFAEILKWPFLNETRDNAEDAYSDLRGGKILSVDLYDWIFGLALPGKWTAHKLICALVLCTPTLHKEIDLPKYFDCGLSLPKKSYWRSRTVLGRVLGCLADIKSICGWIGPCPPLEEPHNKYIRLKARPVAPTKRESHVFYSSSPWDGIQIRPDDELDTYIRELTDEAQWITPEPPVLQMSVVELVAVKVKKLPLDVEFSRNINTLSNSEIEAETEYRASVTFTIDNGEPISYNLYTNPVFVTAPPCRIGPNGAHQVHSRILADMQKNWWDVRDLKGATPEDYDDNGLIVINATGKGAETLARAWCSERGKSALIRKATGPCFACAYKAADSVKMGLGLGVLIWVS